MEVVGTPFGGFTKDFLGNHSPNGRKTFTETFPEAVDGRGQGLEEQLQVEVGRAVETRQVSDRRFENWEDFGLLFGVSCQQKKKKVESRNYFPKVRVRSQFELLQRDLLDSLLQIDFFEFFDKL